MAPSEPRCPICRSSQVGPFADAQDVEYHTTTDTFRYCRCNDCTAVFLPAPPVNRLQEIYPANYYSYQLNGGNPILERIKRQLDARLFRGLLRRIPGERLRVLDVGGGWGWLLSLVRDVSPRVRETHEIDIDSSVRTQAEDAGHQFHAVRVEEFKTNLQFDLILMLNLIEHVADPRAVLTAMEQVLAPNGLMVIKTPNTDTWDCRLFRHRNWGGFHCPRHFVLFTMPGLIRLADEIGLQVDRSVYTQGGPQWAVSVLGWLAQRGMATVTAQQPMYRHPLYGPLLAAGAGIDFVRRPFAPTAQMFVTLRRRPNERKAI